MPAEGGTESHPTTRTGITAGNRDKEWCTASAQFSRGERTLAQRIPFPVCRVSAPAPGGLRGTTRLRPDRRLAL